MASMYGTWHLICAKAVDAGGNQVAAPVDGENVIARIMLTAVGRMSASITDARTTLPPGQTRNYS